MRRNRPRNSRRDGHHTAAVTRGAGDTVVVADLPFGSYNTTPDDAVRNANRLKKEDGADAVKLEGGREVAEAVAAITDAGIPVFGHIGVTPQTEAMSGDDSGFRGRTAAVAEAVLADAKTIDEAGAVGIVVELVTREAARAATDAIDAFTLGTAVRARAWFREFREIVLKCIVYNVT